jgi:Dihaem cytochrome c
MLKRKKYSWLAVVILLIMGIGLTGFIFLERHEREKEDHQGRFAQSVVKGHDRDREPDFEEYGRRRPVNENYRNNCGGCHLTYPSDLLPAASWNKILTRLGDHFGESLSLDDLTREEIRKHLTENSADRSGTKKGGKILRNLGGSSPIRITELPYIRKKHREISPEVFKRKSVGSFSNCLACHKGAEQGDFDDNHAAIPQ